MTAKQTPEQKRHKRLREKRCPVHGLWTYPTNYEGEDWAKDPQGNYYCIAECSRKDCEVLTKRFENDSLPSQVFVETEGALKALREDQLRWAIETALELADEQITAANRMQKQLDPAARDYHLVQDPPPVKKAGEYQLDAAS